MSDTARQTEWLGDALKSSAQLLKSFLSTGGFLSQGSIDILYT